MHESTLGLLLLPTVHGVQLVQVSLVVSLQLNHFLSTVHYVWLGIECTGFLDANVTLTVVRVFRQTTGELAL